MEHSNDYWIYSDLGILLGIAEELQSIEVFFSRKVGEEELECQITLLLLIWAAAGYA